MKIVLDIPEKVKQTFDNANNEDLYGNYYDRNSIIGKAIQNGIPLDDVLNKIRAEFNGYEDTDLIKVKYMRQIIDRYKTR